MSYLINLWLTANTMHSRMESYWISNYKYRNYFRLRQFSLHSFKFRVIQFKCWVHMALVPWFGLTGREYSPIHQQKIGIKTYWTRWDFIGWGEGPPKSLQTVTAATKLRHLLLGRKTMTNLDSILKSRDITLLTKPTICVAEVELEYKSRK